MQAALTVSSWDWPSRWPSTNTSGQDRSCGQSGLLLARRSSLSWPPGAGPRRGTAVLPTRAQPLSRSAAQPRSRSAAQGPVGDYGAAVRPGRSRSFAAALRWPFRCEASSWMRQ